MMQLFVFIGLVICLCFKNEDKKHRTLYDPTRPLLVDNKNYVVTCRSGTEKNLTIEIKITGQKVKNGMDTI